jgi:hypothetical protein
MAEQTLAVNADGTVKCPLCRRLARTTPGGRLYLHDGRKWSIAERKAITCDASRHTLSDAQEMAVRAAAEVDALRRRAHP